MTNNKNELIRVNVILNKDDSGYEQELSARIDPAQLEALGYIKKDKAVEMCEIDKNKIPQGTFGGGIKDNIVVNEFIRLNPIKLKAKSTP